MSGKYIQLPIEVRVFNWQEHRKHLYEESGIYFLVNQGVIEYIGRSVKIGSRLSSHHVFDPCRHNEIYVYRISHREAWKHHYVEDELIKLFKPLLNKAGLSREICANREIAP